ncbi:CD109 antigen-like isoform X1 [Lucilia sericata]|uniref:CD109 antigen-like isoform X1 n=1 Tax=Lucilia sericata TaxID=13632 RepID=UPI0018A83D22|nr:CD109 antigen-like isoform X1 [Lucilia sericata]
MNRTLSSALIFLQILIFVNASGFYSIVAPGTIQSQHDYSVSVTLHENSEPATIKVGIKGPSYNEEKTIDISPSQTEIVNFEIPKLQSGTYQLESEGIKGLIFKNSTELNFKNKEPKVYIQTDKAVYKPGDLVQYRIIVLDENTRPAKLEQPLTLGFKDGGGNFVKQIKDIKLNKGVYTGNFQLSEQPVLGNWLIAVSLGPNEDDTKTEKKFEVAKYVLPKFSVDIETVKDIAYGDPLKITLRSKYTYGKPVKGKAIITVDAGYGQAKAEKIIDVDGKGYAEFDLKKDLNLELSNPNNRFGYYLYVPPINILAVMTEEYTGNKQNKTTSVNLHRSRYIIEVPQNAYEYVINKPFEVKAFVKNLDGTPVQNGKHVAKLSIGRNRQYYGFSPLPIEAELEFTSELDKNGMALFKLTIPSVGYYHDVKVTYADQTKYLGPLTGKEASQTKDNEIKDGEEDVGPLKLVKKTEKLQLDQDVVVDVKSNKYIPYYVYALVARGNIIKQEYVKLPENVKSHKLKFKPSFEMVPKTHLYVYFVLDGDLKFQEIILNFPKEFQNKMEITAPKQAKPSEEVTLNIKTDPDSFVGLLGVDQSVLLLQSGNDLDMRKIIDDLSTYDTSTPYIRGYGTYPGKSSGLITQTNANYPYSTDYPRIYYSRPASGMGFSGAMGFPGPMPQHGIRGYGLVPHILDSAQPQYSTAGLPSSSMIPKIRKEFVENWIFNNLENTDKNGLATLTKKIPDTITSWVVTGFSLNDKTGFGMVTNPTNIEVFQPFFVSTNLPYSVKRGEVISIPVIIFNYMDKALDAEVTMENTDDEYDFTEISNEIEELVLEEKQRVKRVTVPSNSGKSLSFMIRPNKVGEITLKIKAITPLAGDAIHQKLKVEPEGVTKYENHAIFITPSKEPIKETLEAVIPKEAVLDSEYLEFSVVGDILGPTIKNIDQLVRKPYGCGEQNMVNFVPNILVLHYLDAIKRNMPTVVQKAKSYMEVGYQRELTYKHKNGAYSAFGEGSSEPNSWLTAYVARSFIQAKKYITIDSDVIDQALQYVVSNQLENGQFKQTGRLFHPAHQNDVGFTAFALLALLEDMDYSNKYKSEIEKGIKYLVANIDKESDIYALALVVVVLKKVQHPSADKLIEKLEKLAHEENGLKSWTKTSKDHSNDIEITAYILEAYVYTEPAGKLLPIIKWLISNRNSMGGFDSTQDTVVGLQALIKFAEKYIPGGDGKMMITFEALDGEGKETTKGSFSVDKENSLILQTHVLPKSSRQITLEASGEGSSLVQLSYRYNLATKDDKPSFSIKHTIQPTDYPNLLQMDVCADFVPGANSDIKESNMAIMEIYLPSGFTADTDKFDAIRQANQVQRIETKNSDTAIIIYFDFLTAGEEVCFKVNAEKTHAVAKQKPAAITMYDYYNSDQRATVYYEVKSSLCDICEEGECGKGCENKGGNKIA